MASPKVSTLSCDINSDREEICKFLDNVRRTEKGLSLRVIPRSLSP